MVYSCVAVMAPCCPKLRMVNSHKLCATSQIVCRNWHSVMKSKSSMLHYVPRTKQVLYEMQTYIANTYAHTTHADQLSQHKLGSLTHKHPCKETGTQMSHDKLKIPLLPLIMERMQKWPIKCSHLSVHKPLKSTLTTNEKPVQSVSNPVPIWASLKWASYAFVLWLSEGRAPHAPA